MGKVALLCVVALALIGVLWFLGLLNFIGNLDEAQRGVDARVDAEYLGYE